MEGWQNGNAPVSKTGGRIAFRGSNPLPSAELIRDKFFYDYHAIIFRGINIFSKIIKKINSSKIKN